VTAVAGRAGKLASGSRDQTTRTWDIETGKQIGMRKIDRNVVTWIGWRDDNTIVEASEDLSLRIWDIRQKPLKP
jgi:WD40 repeat protein